VQVDIWQKENPSTEFLLGSARRIGLLVSIYTCVCSCSVLFSILPLTGFILGYSLFSASLIVLSLLIPTIPIVRKITTAKYGALHHVNTQIQNEFQRILQHSRSEENQLELTRFEHLIELRDKIENSSVWPFRTKVISTTLSVVFLTALPSILKLFLELYAK
jgi:hypothetical protein